MRLLGGAAVDADGQFVRHLLHAGRERRPLVGRQFVLEERDGDCRRRPSHVVRDGGSNGTETGRHLAMLGGVAALPDLVRVGTVDRFQGQEAPVCLVSMTTSSGEELPRDIAFLFSLNRINVAVSRAQVAAMVFASPLLLETPCRTVEEMSLVNALCALREHGGDSF